MKKYSIIGEPVTHSLSPKLHNYWFRKYKIDAEYSLLPIKEDEIKNVIDKIRSDEISGINVTLPYKKKVIPFLDKLVNDAKDTKSVNTIYKDSNNEIIGDNTDVFGFQSGYIKELEAASLKKQKVLVIGAGGVSPSIILALEKSNIKDISLINRTLEKSMLLQKQFSKIQVIKWAVLESIFENYDIIINATSLGLKNNKQFDVKFKKFRSLAVYIDTIYNPLETLMIKNLRNQNISCSNGLDMFLHQGQKSFYLWNRIRPEIGSDLIETLKKEIE